MSKKRVHELAREYGVDNNAIIEVLHKNNVNVKNSPLSGVDNEAIVFLEKAFKPTAPVKAQAPQPAPKKQKEAGKMEEQTQKQQAPHKNTQKTQDDNKSKGGYRHVQISQGGDRRSHQEQRPQGGNRSQQQERPQGNRDSRNDRNDRNFRSDRGGRPERNDRNDRNQANRNDRPNRNDGNRRFDNRGDNRNNARGGQGQNNFQNRSQRPAQGGAGREDRVKVAPAFDKEALATRPDTKTNKKERRDRDKNRDKQNSKEQRNRPQSLVSTSIAKSKNKVKQRNEQHKQMKAEEKRKAEAAVATIIQLDGPITVKALAEKMGREVSEIIKKLMLMGVMATINQELDLDTAMLVADEFGVEVEEVEPEADITEIEEIVDSEESLLPRPPVVTIMGHVDHGKTSLLDVIRQTNVIATEAGGITQHIGAYQVRYQGNKITFLDTPGHEAFTAMRLRGAQSTDIAVLVVAADDGVMPQTIEAINHAKSAKVPILVAINKMDKPGANPDHVKQQLSEHGLLPEEWGGDVIMVPVSAKKKQGIDDLLENILLIAEVLELKANPNRHAQGIVVEAQLDKGRGPVATVLVQKGTLRVGDTIIAGTAFGKVRAMNNERGEKMKAAKPSVPVEVLGLSDVPQAGEVIYALDDNTAREVAEKRVAKQRIAELQASQKVTLDDIFQQIQQGTLKELNIIIKADVQGSVEALRQSLESIKNDEVRIVIVHAAVGAINESDVMLASASNAFIIGFNVRPDATVRKAAERESVDLRTYRVIYDAINDVENAMRGMLTPEFKEVILGRAEVRQVISTPKAIVAGSYVTEGKMTNNADIRLIRDGIVVHEGKVDSLRRFKDEAKEVQTGFECGISIERYRDIKEGDVIEAFTMEEIAPTL